MSCPRSSNSKEKRYLPRLALCDFCGARQPDNVTVRKEHTKACPKAPPAVRRSLGWKGPVPVSGLWVAELVIVYVVVAVVRATALVAHTPMLPTGGCNRTDEIMFLPVFHRPYHWSTIRTKTWSTTAHCRQGDVPSTFLGSLISSLVLCDTTTGR